MIQLIEKHFDGSVQEREQLLASVQDQKKQLRKQELDFLTTFEIVSQINLKGLDSKKIESYVLTTLRGQFGVLKVQLLRHDVDGSSQMKAHGAGSTIMGFDTDGDLAYALKECHGVVFFDDASESVLACPEVQSWREQGFVMFCKLRGRTDDLNGLLLLGPKFTKLDYSKHDLKFLNMIGSIVGIALSNAQLYMSSIHDSLTNVYTRGHFDLQLKLEIDRLKRYQDRVAGANRSVSLIMLDLDKFKGINDSYGHQVGDAALIFLARVLKESVRSMDVVARFGGDEFALVCPETPKAEAVMLAERLRKKIADGSIKATESEVISITSSIGVATFPDDCDSARELLFEADKALFKSKELGRNQVSAAPTESDSI